VRVSLLIALALCVLALVASLIGRRNRRRRPRLPPPDAAAIRTGYRDYKRHDLH
jgi:hypothetical protein